MLTFVVKRSIGDSAGMNELYKRQIVAPELLHLGNDFATYKAPMENFAKVQAWFCEHSECIPGKGYPNGTCLIYSIHENAS